MAVTTALGVGGQQMYLLVFKCSESIPSSSTFNPSCSSKRFFADRRAPTNAITNLLIAHGKTELAALSSLTSSLSWSVTGRTCWLPVGYAKVRRCILGLLYTISAMYDPHFAIARVPDQSSFIKMASVISLGICWNIDSSYKGTRVSVDGSNHEELVADHLFGFFARLHGLSTSVGGDTIQEPRRLGHVGALIVLMQAADEEFVVLVSAPISVYELVQDSSSCESWRNVDRSQELWLCGL